MKPYSSFRPTAMDPAGLSLPDRQEWLVAPVSRTRDSGPLAESNFSVALKSMGGEGPDVEIHRFGHWGPGWFEIILVRPGSPAETEARDIENALADYPILDESDHSDREQTAANETWSHCYRTADRIEYVREHREQFEFRGFADLLGCIRGHYFAGYPSELIEDSGY